MRLKPELWDAADEICQREGINLQELFARVESASFPGSRTAALRAFMLEYFRNAATEKGHRAAGHGNIE